MACGGLLLFDPNRAGIYPVCPFLLLTGRWCPGCGSLRGIRALLTGDVRTAIDLNVLMVVTLPYLAYRWLAWCVPAVRERAARMYQPPVWAIPAYFGVVALFWLLRNLPSQPFAALAP